MALKCGDCGTLLKSIEEAQEHSELTKHTDFSLSTEAVLNLVCSTCGKPCQSKTESDLHTKRTGHTEFSDKTLDNAKPIALDVRTRGEPDEMVVPDVDSKLLEELESIGFSKERATRALHFSGNSSFEAAANWIVEHEEDVDIDQMPLVSSKIKLERVKPSLTLEERTAKSEELRERAPENKKRKRKEWKEKVRRERGRKKKEEEEQIMVVPDVDLKLLEELEQIGFSKESATRALHFSGNSSLEAAVNWIVEHEEDADINQMPLVSSKSKSEPAKRSLTPEERKAKAQERRKRARKEKKRKKGEIMEREREKELLGAKCMEEENERKRIIAWRKVEKEEERRVREKIRQKLEEDKAEKRRKLGLPAEDHTTAKSLAPVMEEKKSSLPIRPATKSEQMKECLRSIKQSNKDDDAKVKTAFNTLLTYVKNIATKPDEEKFHKIRLSNAAFQDRVGKLEGGIKFLELCGFEKIEGGEFLFLARDKIDRFVLNSAGSELNSAIDNPFFGVL